MSKQTQDKVFRDVDRYRILFEQSPVCIHEIDTEGRLLSINRAGLDLVGIEHEEQVCGQAYLNFVSLPERERVQRLMDDAFKGQASEFEFQTAESPPLKYFSSCFIPCPEEDGKITRLIGISLDITKSKESETKIISLNRTHELLSSSCCSLARAVDEKTLINAFCRNVHEIGGYSFSWMGYAQHDGSSHPHLIETSGNIDAQTAANVLSCPDPACSTPCPSEIAVETGETVVLQNLEVKSYCSCWSDLAIRYDHLSIIALPLKVDETILGSFTIFSANREAFSSKEVSLLEELAEVLSQGIETMRIQATRAQRMFQFKNEVEQNERKRIADALHDKVAQTVQAINLGLKSVGVRSNNEQQATTELLNKIIDNVESVIDELRDISHDLRPVFLERMEFEEAVRYHCDELNQHSKGCIRVSSGNQNSRFDELNKEQCFLSFREAMNNAVRHAEATLIEVIMEEITPGVFSIQIRDNGVGFNTNHKFHLPSGLGLSMISERVQSIGGHAEIHSSPGKGTQVTLIAPVKG